MSVHAVAWGRPACDPEVPGRLRRLAGQGKINRSASGFLVHSRLWLDAASARARRAVISCWLLSAGCFVVAFAGLFSPGWIEAWLAAAAATAVSAVVLGKRLSPERELWHSRDRVIFPFTLDQPDRLLLARAQRAIDAILGSSVRAAGLMEHAADEMTLQRHEWEVACALRDMTGLRAQLAQHAPARPAGAMTAAVLDSQRRAIALAQDATAARVSALERYASLIKAADDAHCDWRKALHLAGLNDQYLDLVARTAADELAISEIAILAEQAAVTVQALRYSLQEANLAAEVLALPRGQAG
jgi:hypothetical protein